MVALQKTRPVIFLAFANSSANPLPHLAEECRRLTDIVEDAAHAGICDLLVRPYATVDQILDAFDQEEERGRIAVFHYAGHADGFALLLEGTDGAPAVAHAGGLAAFLAHQPGLRLVFLNGCSTEPQVQGLLDAGVQVVVATAQAIDDQVATDFAGHFYRYLAQLDPIQQAYEKAQAAVQTVRGGDTRNLYLVGTPPSVATDRWPWALYQRPGGEAAEWRLADATTGGIPAPGATQVSTGGGAFIAGSVDTGGGDFAGRDKFTIVVETPADAVAVARQLQQKAELLEPDLPCKPFEPKTVLIPAGPFLMGSSSGPGIPAYEAPQHEVMLAAYRIGKYPVTNRQYAEFLKRVKTQEEPQRVGWFLRAPPKEKLDHPVVGVSWPDASAYCAWLSQATGRTYRLPSEAEWEKAARGGDDRRYPWGEEWEDGCCNVTGDDTTPVTAFPQGASPYGCLDLLGNVQEWTKTLWGSRLDAPDFAYPYDPQDGRETDEPGDLPPQVHLVHRGSSFNSAPDELRCAARGHADPASKIAWRGFRVVLEV